MKQAFLISCSDHYDHRMIHWANSLSALGYEPVYLTSDFNHTTKESFCCSVPGCVQLHVLPYRKNLSVSRILSHRGFARDVCKWLEAQDEAPDYIVSLLPPNFLAAYLGRYKKRHPGTTLVFDIFDLWPETFPSSKAKQLLKLPFQIWAGLRDRNLGTADYVTTECDMFRKMLGLSAGASKTVHFSLSPYIGPEFSAVRPTDHAEIAYLGAVNNIIDIPAIAGFLQALSAHMPVRLHIIGSGENLTAFCEAASAAGAEVISYGPIFEEPEKHRILSGCHFGLNVMKDSVCIGLTMKSVDYLRHGLPIVSNIGGDTADLVAQRGIGIALHNANDAARQTAEAIRHNYQTYMYAAKETFSAYFSSYIAEERCTGILRTLRSSQTEQL